MGQTRREFLRRAAAGALATGLAGIAEAAPRRKPNIVYFVSDELGYYELSCMGHPHFKTPNIDRMAAQGMRFTQALAGAPVCAPTRCCLMTGKHAGHTSVRVNDGATPLRPEEVTIASALKEVGYATGGFGKWGCGGRGSTGVPEKHGFDVFFGYYDQVHAHSYYPPYLVRNSEEVPLPGNVGGRSGKTYSHYVIMEEAKKFIRQNKDRPFFCYLPVTPPHGMHDIPETDPSWQLYKDKPWPEPAKVYAAMVNMVDRNVGEVLALLRELGLERDTIVLLSGDNGGADYFRTKDRPRGFHGPNVNPKTGVAFRGHKGNLYEGGLRVPMIAYWPGRIKPGQVSDLLWYFPDIFPTFAELAGAKTPDDLDGISVVPTLLGEDVAGRKQEQHEYLYWEYGGQVAVRQGNWKAIRTRGKWELYDLATDIEEKNNLAEKHPDILARLKKFAEEAHEPARPGTFFDRSLTDRDRWAKWGTSRKQKPPRKPNRLPTKGLIPRKNYRLVRVSSENSANGRLARCAFDGNPSTHWHSQFMPQLAKHPHELVIDLGGQHTITGFRYLARQDEGWNGALKDAEFYVGNDPDHCDKLAAKATFKKVKTPQEVRCEPVKARYVRLRILSEVNGNPWASIAELGVVGK